MESLNREIRERKPSCVCVCVCVLNYWVSDRQGIELKLFITFLNPLTNSRRRYNYYPRVRLLT